jgi:hypothetical protein
MVYWGERHSNLPQRDITTYSIEQKYFLMYNHIYDIQHLIFLLHNY